MTLLYGLSGTYVILFEISVTWSNCKVFLPSHNHSSIKTPQVNTLKLTPKQDITIPNQASSPLCTMSLRHSLSNIRQFPPEDHSILLTHIPKHVFRLHILLTFREVIVDIRAPSSGRCWLLSGFLENLLSVELEKILAIQINFESIPSAFWGFWELVLLRK